MKIKWLSKVAQFVVENKNTFLTIAEVAGVALTGYTSYRATKKYVEAKEDFEDLSAKEEMRETVKIFALPAVVGAATISVCVFHNYINVKDLAALAALYKVSENKRADLLEASKMTIGEKKTDEVRQTAAKVTAERLCNDGKPWGYTGKGDYPCIDKVFDSKFKATQESIKAAFNAINERVVDPNEEFIPVNDLRLELGLPLLGGRIGEDNGFPSKQCGGSLITIDNGNLRFDTTFVDGVGPVLVFEYDTQTAPWANEKILY